MKRALIIIVIIAALAAAGFFFFQRSQQQQQQALMENLQTVAIERGPLTATIGATGTVRANQSALLSWQTSGAVEAVNVEIGTPVETGQLLANLNKTSLSQSIILAEADLIDAQKALDDLLEPATQLALAQAQQAIVDAGKRVEDAETRLNSLKTTADQADIDSAQATVIILRDQLERAQKDFRPYENKAEDNLIRANLQAALSRAQQNYDNAVTRLNNLKGTASETDLAIAEANLEVAQASLEDAQEKYDDLVSGPTQEDIQRLETRIAAIEATLKLPQIEAPFNGTITRVDTKVGDQVNPGTPAFRVDDLSHLLVDVGISEVDINRVSLGQEATLQFDGIPDQTYSGVVVEVDPVGSVNQGIVEFQVAIEITNPDEAVKPSMTAAVNIVVNQLQDVLMIPNRAVRVLNGDRVVYILANGQLTPVNITLGVSSDTMSEVTNTDLKVGDLVVLNPPQVFEVGGGPPPFVNQ
jgi:HlyD family secretion protein